MSFIVLAVLVVALLLTVAATFNRLVRARNAVESSWAQVDVQLQRRGDLIPNLIETVKGYAAHESGVLEAVTAARTSAMTAGGVADRGRAENALSGALKSLFAVAESYPDLKASGNFAALQEELAGTESRIAFARQTYNDSVRGYNTRVQTFPASIFAAAFGFKPREYFGADPAAQGNVQVSF